MRTLMLIFFSLTLTSCASTAPFAIASKNAWFLEKNANGTFSPMYCMANEVNEKNAKPNCYVAKKIDRTEKNKNNKKK